ncbi:MAG: Crp/Fnr family transcriptional regulator [Sphingomonadaceae bacterium]|nr:Crp/Fnr family transcriptional regulator [Sphingomonadaceae bacterium]
MPDNNRGALSAFLARISRRSVLDGDEIEAILSLPTIEHRVRANQDIVRLGERIDHACLVVEGLVGRFGQTSSGERQIIALHIPGDMADLHSVVSPLVTVPLQALTASTIIRIPHVALRKIAARHPAVATAFWRDCMIDLAIMAQWLLSIGRRSAKARLAHLLCEMALRYEQIGACSSEGFLFPATQNHIGDALGLTAVHVNRMFGALKRDGLIDVKGREITINDGKGLAAVSEFDPAYLQFEALDLHQR